MVLGVTGLFIIKKVNLNTQYSIGQKLDSLNGVVVYFNGGVDHVGGRNVAEDGYNLGLKYQCVEFVKRYYYQHLNHRMPDTYGHAKDFFDKSVADGQRNKSRNLIQYANGSQSQPQVSDLLVFDKTGYNKYGHVAIVSKVLPDEVEIIQQNPGPFGKSRVSYSLKNSNGKLQIENQRILGWLRKGR